MQPNETPVPPLAYSIAGATACTGLPRTTIFNAIKQGQIEARKSGRRTVVIGDSLRAFVADLPAARPARAA